jgi:arylsulfatase A-like enzyme
MTGRYNYRTDVVDTYLGRSLMHPDETTIGEFLSQAGTAPASSANGTWGTTYLAFNAPHTPLEVPADKYAKYKRMNLQAGDFIGAGHPVARNFDPDVTANIYGMVENIDDNVGRVLAALDDLNLTGCRVETV